MKSHIDEIGYWSEVKLDIIKKYAAAYSIILSKQAKLTYVFIDAFCGSGVHKSRTSGELVDGSPAVALSINPPFGEYHFIDLDQGKLDVLTKEIHSRFRDSEDASDIFTYNADCNQVLLDHVFPHVRYEDYRRALCLLDPYGLHLDWEVIRTAGSMKSIEIFLNFPIGDMNRNVLHKNPSSVEPQQAERLTRYWGDESWRDAAYTREASLFGYEDKTTNNSVVRAFGERLRTAASFAYVPEPMPMRNSRGAIVYYLFFASQNRTGGKIVKEIFCKYKDREMRSGC